MWIRNWGALGEALKSLDSKFDNRFDAIDRKFKAVDKKLNSWMVMFVGMVIVKGRFNMFMDYERNHRKVKA